MKNLLFVMLALVLSGCASHIPLTVRKAPTPNPTLADALAQAEPLKQPVRWGGTILAVVNHPNDTEIEILAKKLGRYGKPSDGDDTQGRFLARVDGFLDPAVYAQGRLVTVFGLIDALVERNVGEKPYRYPLIKAQSQYLWPREVENPYPGYYPYGYYGPYGFYPYGYRYGFGYRRW
ncbi:Slp family lipoprotein [Methylomonas rivi]|uniref:Slp family lipoprotein n=1 Tax=Methylomonas rivi TaxID=2952226 RepID=A0ABT1U7L7_9GAMM|nr:Slp family lipoprotein [Methylomonas sp. WSC-6]MCQ8129848.1 Slp family lipoprotein [Methylomonas sp. WSC-6]